MNLLKIHLLGPFRATLAGRALEQFDTNKTRALLAYLAVESGRVQRRESLAGMFWPDFPNAAALRNLRLTLFRLRQTLSEAASQAGLSETVSFIDFHDRHTLQFNLNSPTWIDIHEFEALTNHVAQHSHPHPLQCPGCIAQLTQAVSYDRGEFMAGFALKDSYGFEEWLLLRREHLTQKMLAALDTLANHHLGQAESAASSAGRQQALEKASRYTARILQSEPWRETAHRQMMKILAYRGQVQEALAQYLTCRQVLAAEFNLAPDAATGALYQQIRDGTCRLPALPPAAQPAPSPPPHNLPPQLTPLIGRQAQLERLEHLIFSYRWVTLVGQGGIGKSRLARAAAERLLARFPGGVWWIPLDESVPLPASSPPELQAALARNLATYLRLQLDPRSSPEAQVLGFLQARQLLLVLDSFEYYSPAAAFLLDLLVQAPGVHLLVTSRHDLNFQAGYIMRVEGLPIPPTDDDPSGAEYASVQLFAERAERLAGSFTLDEKTLPEVIRICRQLDGIPLAIELAAPWATRLSLAAISACLQTDLDFLSTAMTGMPARHRSMRLVFESAWGWLSPAQQRLLAACSALPAAFTRQQAQQASPDASPEFDALVDQFLVTPLAPGNYTIHQILRQFAQEKLAALDPPAPRPAAVQSS